MEMVEVEMVLRGAVKDEMREYALCGFDAWFDSMRGDGVKEGEGKRDDGKKDV